MSLLSGLGRKLPHEEVAEIFEVATETILREPALYGGVRFGRRSLFFDNLISERVRETHAVQKEEERKKRLGRRGNGGRAEEVEGVPDQIGGEGLGRDVEEGDEGVLATYGRTYEDDPFSLVA